MRQVNEATFDLIRSFEQCRLCVYDDGFGYPTVGWGHRTHLPIGQAITQEQADQWFEDDVAIASLDVERLAKFELNDNQFGALVSLVFNIGEGNFEQSRLLRDLNAGDLSDIPKEDARWDHAGGRHVLGLHRRRDAEIILWNTPADLDENPTVGSGL